MTSADDEQLLGRVGRGDRTAFRALVERYSGRSLALATRVIGDRSLAEDAVQDAFLEIWQRADRYDRARGTPRSWILTVVHFKAVDTVRRQEASERTSIQAEPSVSPDPAEAGVASDRRDRVLSALDDLSPVQREAIHLAYFGGLTYRQVADRLEIPEGTAKSRLRDGLLNLRGLMERHGIEWANG